MKILILGCGAAGTNIARRAKAKGWEVVGTTTTPGRVPEIEAVADKAVVLVGSDRAAVKAAAEGADAIVVSVSPSAVRSAKKEDRGPIYQEVLVESAKSAVEANDRVVFMSSISVYGDGTQEPRDFIDEDTPRATHDDEPSTIYFSAGEDEALKAPQGTALRFPDIYEAPDVFAGRVKLAHDYMGGSVPFAREDRYHPISVEDAARSVIFALESGITGAYNVVPDGLPAPTVGEFWDKVADASGQDRLEFRGEIRTPVQPAVSKKIRGEGFVFEHQIDEVV
jgi:nucleoside-diphosphate-sugar epimerase